MIKLIAAVGKNGELGKNGKLIWNLPSDLKFFSKQTSYHTIVMGRNTFNSLPKILPNRTHFVLATKDEFNKEITEAYFFKEFNFLLRAVLEEAKEWDVFIIGGASMYEQFLEYADEIILTEIDACDKNADVYFPTFDKNEYERIHIGFGEDNGIKYEHVKYVRK